MSKGINVRFTIPEGSVLEKHLSELSSSRARSFELVRLATNALEISAGSLHEKVPMQVTHEDPLRPDTAKTQSAPESLKKEEPGFADMDLLQIGSD